MQPGSDTPFDPASYGRFAAQDYDDLYAELDPEGAVEVLTDLANVVYANQPSGAPVTDAGAAPYQERAGRPRDVLALLAPDLAADPDLVAELDRLM